MILGSEPGKREQPLKAHSWMGLIMDDRLSPTGDLLRKCMESTQDWLACVMRHVGPELLMSLHFGIPPACRGHSPRCWEGSPARKKDAGAGDGTLPTAAAELRWTLGIQSEAQAASVPGCIETEEAPNQWSFETSCFI